MKSIEGDQSSLSQGVSARLAIRYAKAMAGYAAERGAIESAYRDAESLLRAIAISPPLTRFLAENGMTQTDATRVMTVLSQRLNFGSAIKNLISLAIANRRLSILPEILRAFLAFESEGKGEVTAHISTAHALDEPARTALRARLAAAGYATVHLSERVDPQLLGGIVVRIGSVLFDSSLSGRLARLHYAMKGAA